MDNYKKNTIFTLSFTFVTAIIFMIIVGLTACSNADSVNNTGSIDNVPNNDWSFLTDYTTRSRLLVWYNLDQSEVLHQILNDFEQKNSDRVIIVPVNLDIDNPQTEIPSHIIVGAETSSKKGCRKTLRLHRIQLSSGRWK